jgi:hypothetical protein
MLALFDALASYLCRMVRKLLWAVAALSLLFVGLAAWLGAFTKLQISDSIQGGYVVAGYDHTGPFEKIGSAFKRAQATADSLGLSSDEMIGIYYSNPEEVKEDSLLSYAGVVLGRTSENLGTMDFADLRLERIPEGRALWIDFAKPNDLAIVVGALRAYPMLTKASIEAGLEPGWVYEIHSEGMIRFVFQEYPVAEEAIDL